MWAAEWLVEGYDGDALRELAGLSGRDTRAVRDMLPAALEDARVTVPTPQEAAVKITYDHIARMHLDGAAAGSWVVQKVAELIENAGHDPAFCEQPLGQLFGVDDELDTGWGRNDEEIMRVIHEACVDQIGLRSDRA